MKLSCPKCSEEIPPANINIAEGICACPRCGEVFKIAPFLRDEATVERIPKPAGSRVELLEEKDSLGLIVPPGSNRGAAWFLLLFALFWNGITWPMVIANVFGLRHTTGLSVFGTLFMIPFICVGVVVLVAALYMFSGEFTLLIDRSECRASWKLYRWSHTKVVPTGDLKGVVEQVSYTQNDRPVYGIGLQYGTKSLKFGAGLTAEERRWLVGELRHFLKLP